MIRITLTTAALSALLLAATPSAGLSQTTAPTGAEAYAPVYAVVFHADPVVTADGQPGYAYYLNRGPYGPELKVIHAGDRAFRPGERVIVRYVEGQATLETAPPPPSADYAATWFPRRARLDNSERH